jgi:hypothetical protein
MALGRAIRGLGRNGKAITIKAWTRKLGYAPRRLVDTHCVIGDVVDVFGNLLVGSRIEPRRSGRDATSS